MKQEVDKVKLLKEVNEKIQEMDELSEVEDMIKDNCIEFDIAGVLYRVRKPGRREKMELRSLKTKKKNELLRDPASITEAELIQIYLDRDIPIDIDALRSQIKTIQSKISSMAVKFVEIPIASERKKLEVELTALQEEQNGIYAHISDLMDSCIEKQLQDFVQECLVGTCLERQVDSKWARHYENHDAFMEAEGEIDEALLYKATWYFSVLINKDA